jgi:putative restriction endonuclease
MLPGEPVFFRLKNPINAVAGYGYFAHHTVLDLDQAWGTFQSKNGAPDKATFLRRIGGYRGLDLRSADVERRPLGCTILRDARFWERSRWIQWGAEEGWKPNIVQGKTETDPKLVSRLLGELAFEQLDAPADLVDEYVPAEIDERQIVLARTVRREGQGAFRTRLLDAYGRRCAITGERTEPVLAAAHVQPYLGPKSNHIQNGILLTQEFHTLFDNGLITVTPDLEVRVSPRIRERWSNGRRFYDFDGRALRAPDDPAARPSVAALAWHAERMFQD